MSIFSRFFNDSDSDVEEERIIQPEVEEVQADDRRPNNETDEEDVKLLDKEKLKKGRNIIIIAFIVSSVSFIIGRLIGNKLGFWWGFPTAMIAAVIFLLILDAAFGASNKRLTAAVIGILSLFFFIHLVNILADTRNNLIREREEKAAEEKVVELPKAVASPSNILVVLSPGDNVFSLKNGERTPTLKFPDRMKINYSIFSENGNYRTHFTDGTSYGPDEAIPHKRNPLFWVTVSGDEEIKISVVATEKN